MDDQNNNPGGTTPSEPTTPEPAPTVPEPAPVTPQPPAEAGGTEKCLTCGNATSSGNCVACGQGETACVCPPSSGQGAPPSPVGEPSPSAPAI